MKELGLCTNSAPAQNNIIANCWRNAVKSPVQQGKAKSGWRLALWLKS
ncbi:hypothetical protein KCP69_15680 [Salmonella enterica subsp. enterica]|nr:hypothetical protein KCP69_15680 [Salmonella enterica subsp. enterica]